MQPEGERKRDTFEGHKHYTHTEPIVHLSKYNAMLAYSPLPARNNHIKWFIKKNM